MMDVIMSRMGEMNGYELLVTWIFIISTPVTFGYAFRVWWENRKKK